MGIAVGMATSIPPHNLGEVIDGTIAFINNKDITIGQLMKHVPGPDFPTGGIIIGKDISNGVSSSGKTTDSESVIGGSNPSTPTILR